MGHIMGCPELSRGCSWSSTHQLVLLGKAQMAEIPVFPNQFTFPSQSSDSDFSEDKNRTWQSLLSSQ